MIRRFATLACVAFALLVALPALGQQWPAKPVKFIVPFPPGGSVDPLARLLASRLTETLGMDVQSSTPEALQKFLVGEIARWGKVVKDNSIKAD